MVKNGWHLFFSALFILFSIFIVCIFLFISKHEIKIVYSSSASLGNKKLLSWSNSLNVEQSFNACGPYSTMAYAYSITGLILDPEEINHEMSDRFGDGLTYPWGITKYLKKKGIKTHIYFLGLLSKEKKHDWLRKKIESGSPVVVVVGDSTYSHYLTILGYNDDVLYKYDSYLTSDENGAELGNSTEKIDSLIERMEGVRFYGFPINLAISF